MSKPSDNTASTIQQTGNEMVVTPWEVSGKINYERLIEEFGTQPISDLLLERVKRFSGDLHIQLKRKVFFSHRDFDWILDMYDRGNKFVLYTGRGPSGPVHIGHLLPWLFTRHLQEVFDTKLYFQLTDDEKFLVNAGATVDDTRKWAYENALDLAALGFRPEKTRIISDLQNIKPLYQLAVRIAKHMTFSTVKATFGFTESSNIGMIFFPAMQAAPAFIESELRGENVPCLIPAAIDQDPYWRITRDVAPKLGFLKPAQIHSRFLPGLGKGGKMSASQPETCIYTTDSLEVAEKKIMNAFTGGRDTAEEQRRLGANPYICPIYHYENWIFMENDNDIEKLRLDCLSGNLLCGDCKGMLVERVKRFLKDHQAKREKARSIIDQYFVKDDELQSALEKVPRTLRA